jgi:endoglucanase
MARELEDELKALIGAPGLSGIEEPVAEILKKMVPRVKMREDPLGNLIMEKGDKGKKVMICAHMDEVGFRVKYIDEKGFLKFVPVGGIDERILPASRVRLLTREGWLEGVIGTKPIHQLTEEERKKSPKLEDMYVDVGAGSRKDAEKAGIEVGTPILFPDDFYSNGKVAMGKAMDDRVGCLVLAMIMGEAVREGGLLYGVGSVQEEVGLKGARTAAFSLTPDLAIVVDTTPAGDTPGFKEGDQPIEVGKGPVFGLAEGGGRGLITNERLLTMLKESARKEDVPYQLELGGGMTDGAAVYITKEGIPTCSVSIATRYLHTGFSLVNWEDIRWTIKLLKRLIYDL